MCLMIALIWNYYLYKRLIDVFFQTKWPYSTEFRQNIIEKNEIVFGQLKNKKIIIIH